MMVGRMTWWVGLAVVSYATLGLAVDITLDKNGLQTYNFRNGGQLTGPGIVGFQQFSAGSAPVTFTNLLANSTYSVDFFHNFGSSGSDFSFKINAAGTGVELVNPSGGGYTMVTNFTPGDTTLTLNTHPVTYNANSGQEGGYYVLHSIIANSLPQNSGPTNLFLVGGRVPVDNLYNTGSGNEDYSFQVNGDGSVSAFAGFEEYATFLGNTVNPRSTLVHYVIHSSTNLSGTLFIPYRFPLYNTSSSVLPDGELRYVYSFDLLQPIGNAGHLIEAFGSNTVVGGNLMGSTNFSIHVEGPSVVGTTRANDYLFAPRLRFTNDLAASFSRDGYYFWNTDGFARDVTLRISGFNNGNTVPLTLSINAAIPEPVSVSLLILSAGMIAVLRRRTNG